jgi:hypothetical protein
MKTEIEDRFGLVWPHHVGNLTQFLIAARKSFDGDLDMFLVLAVVGDRTFSAASVDPNLTYTAWQEDASRHSVPLSINARSIADYTGIPRETVRRKLLLLEEKGWIARHAGDTLQATNKARRELEPLTLASIRYLEKLFKLFQTLLAK